MLRFIAVSGQIAWKALGRNRLRTGLTTLGVVIGVAAVIAMVALGNGARASVERTLQVGRHQHRAGQRRQLHPGRREHEHRLGPRRGDHAHPRRRRGDPRPRQRGARRRRPALAHLRRSRRPRPACSRWSTAPSRRWPTSTAGPGSRGRASPTHDVAAAAAKVVLGRVASARLFGDGVDPDRPHGDDPRPRVRGRRADARRRCRSGRSGVRAGDHAGRADQPHVVLQTITVGVTEAGVATSVGDAITGAAARAARVEHPRDRGPRLGRARRAAVARWRQRPAGPGRRLHGADAGRRSR